MYSEKDPVRIKREVQKWQADLEKVEKEIKDKTKQLAILASSFEKQKESFSQRFDSFVMNVLTIIRDKKDDIQKVHVEEKKAERDYSNISNELNAKKEYIQNFSFPDDTYLKSLEKNITQSLGKIVADIGKKEEQVLKLKKAEDEKNKSISQLNITEQKKKKEVETLQKNIKIVRADYEKLQRIVDDIRKRERASRVMSRRLSKEYLKKYRGLPFKKE